MTLSRREWLFALAGAAAAPSVPAIGAPSKPMRGAFIIMATPYKDNKQKDLDFGDLAGEVDFLDRCGVQGMVWPQMASEYNLLTKAERIEGMTVLAKAAKGKKPALILGVQADDTAAMLEYARHAESLAPDGLIAMPPKKASSLDDFREYYRALCKTTSRPVFIQTTGGAGGIEPTVEFVVGLAKEFPNFGYVKEEYRPVIERMIEFDRNRDKGIKSIFSGAAGRGWTYEMRLGFDGTMPGAMFADVYARLWSLHLQGKREQIREIFSRLLLMINLDQQIPGVRNYIFKKRGIFKTMVSRRMEVKISKDAEREIDYNFEALKPYLTV